MPESRHSSDARRSRVPEVALWFGLAGIVVSVVALVTGLVSASDPAVGMVTALLVIPLAALLSLVLGIVAVILATLAAVRKLEPRNRWIWGLVLGVLGILVIPAFFLVATTAGL